MSMSDLDRKLVRLMSEKSAKRVYLVLTRLCSILSDKAFLSIAYAIRMRKRIRWDAPVSFNEKLQVLKLKRKGTSVYKYVDKYEVRQLVKSLFPNDEVRLIPLLGVYDSPGEVELDKLPEEFVVKCTHDSGSVVLCRSQEDFIKNKKMLELALKNDYFLRTRDYCYKGIKPRLVIEEMMHNGEAGEKDTLVDFKFYCFGGEPEYVYVSTDLDDHAKTRLSFFNIDLSPASFGRNDYAPLEEIPFVPDRYEDMVGFARKLAAPFEFVRVDLYSIGADIYFSELTFSPCNGMMPFRPASYDVELGKKLKITND